MVFASVALTQAQHATEPVVAASPELQAGRSNWRFWLLTAACVAWALPWAVASGSALFASSGRVAMAPSGWLAVLAVKVAWVGLAHKAAVLRARKMATEVKRD